MTTELNDREIRAIEDANTLVLKLSNLLNDSPDAKHMIRSTRVLGNLIELQGWMMEAKCKSGHWPDMGKLDHAYIHPYTQMNANALTRWQRFKLLWKMAKKENFYAPPVEKLRCIKTDGWLKVGESYTFTGYYSEGWVTVAESPMSYPASYFINIGSKSSVGLLK